MWFGRTIRQARWFLLVTLGALLVSACGSAQPAPATGGAQPAPAPAAPAPAPASGGSLNMLVWEGYTDDSFVKPFVAQTGCKVQATYAGSSDEMVAKFQAGGGGVYDLVSASGDATLRLIQAGAVAPIDLSKVTTFNDIAPNLQKPEHNFQNGKSYGVSFMWGPDPLIYNTQTVTKAPGSWADIYDAKYKGRLTVPDNPIFLADVAIHLGIADPYTLSDSQLAQVKAKMLQLKPNVRKYWTSAGEFDNMFLNKEVDLGIGWPLMTVELKKAGFPAGETIPGQEPTTGWADSWMISAKSQNVDCAYKWINYVTSPEVQAKVIDVTGYSPVNLKTAQVIGQERAAALHITDTAYFNKIKFWKTPANYEKWVDIWNEVKQ